MTYQGKVSAAIVAESEKKSYLFKVHGYSRLTDLFKTGEFVASPLFSFGGGNWVLRYYPNGWSASAHSSSIYLVCESADAKDVNAKARSIRVLDKDGHAVPITFLSGLGGMIEILNMTLIFH